MEIRVYKNASDWSAKKCSFAHRIETSDLLFPYESVIRAFKAIYGEMCIIDLIVL